MPGNLVENLIKYGLLIATLPIWWPILKTLFEELQYALWREGGLIGRPPTSEEIPVLEKRYADWPTPFLSESYAQHTERAKFEEEERRAEKRAGGAKAVAARAAKDAATAERAGPGSGGRRGGTTLRPARRAGRQDGGNSGQRPGQRSSRQGGQPGGQPGSQPGRQRGGRRNSQAASRGRIVRRPAQPSKRGSGRRGF